MARKRLSDVAGVQTMPAPGGGGETHHSRTVRPIENGFICTESRHTAQGNYTHREYYSPEHPDNLPSKDRMVGAENLRAGIRALKE